jgi:citrate synthase
VLNSTLVVIAGHGLVPSVQAARMTLTAAPDAMHGAVAAGLLGSGSVILGVSDTAGRLFLAVEKEAEKQGGDLHAATRSVVADLRARKLPIAGYGHPEHKRSDPGAVRLLEVSIEAGGGQRYVEIAKEVQSVIPEVVGKELRMNVSGAIPAVLLGIGFLLNALKGVPMLARTASLIAHLNEELEDPIGFALSYQATHRQQYIGEKPTAV